MDWGSTSTPKDTEEEETRGRSSPSPRKRRRKSAWPLSPPRFPCRRSLRLLHTPSAIPPTPSAWMSMLFCFCQLVDSYVFYVCPPPLHALRVASAVPLRHPRRFLVPGILVQEVDCYIICDAQVAAIGLGASFHLWLSS